MEKAKEKRLNEAEVIKEIEGLKKKLSLNCLELENFLYYQDVCVFRKGFFGFCIGDRANCAIEFKRGYDTLSALEKAEYYLRCLKIVNELSNGKDKKDDE
jgi:hypothetical protein